MSQNSVSCMPTSNQKRKMSESYAKAGDPIARLPCEKEYPLYVACRNETVGENVKNITVAYSKLSDKELDDATEELEAYFECDGDTQQKLINEDGVPKCYVDNMSQKQICLLNNIKKMSSVAQVVQAYNMFQQQYFENKGMEADWARLLALWVFEYDATMENDSLLCLGKNRMLSHFLNEQNIKNVPEFKKCNTNDIGVWIKKYTGKNKSFTDKPLLIFNKNDAYIKDIMKRKPYQYAIKQIKRAIQKLPQEQRNQENIEKLIKDMNGIGNFTYTGPMSGTDEYNVLEWYLGTYHTDITVVDYNEQTGELKVNVVTENMSHWQSAMRLPNAIKKQRFMDFFGNPEYLYDNKELGEIGDFDVERLDMLILMLPSQLIASSAGAYKEYTLSNGKAWDTLAGMFDIDKKYVNYYKWGFFAHNFFGGSFVQRFEGEDIIKIDDLWCKEATVYFNLDESSLQGFRRDQAVQILDNVVEEAEARNCKLKLEVRGYADATGTESYNKILSQKRADTIANYLGSKLILAEVSSIGYGESSLMVPSIPESALNRRVEIWIEEIL